MPDDFYIFIAAGCCILYLVLAVAAISLCVVLYRHSQNIGWLFLGVVFVQPLLRVISRLTHGLPVLWYQTSSSVGPDGIITQRIQYDIPVLYTFAVVGLFFLYRRARHGKPSA